LKGARTAFNFPVANTTAAPFRGGFFCRFAYCRKRLVAAPLLFGEHCRQQLLEFAIIKVLDRARQIFRQHMS
jgi:hypothetical protein